MNEQLLVLRTCNADGTSRNGFRWPRRGKVVAPDWDPTPLCGRGLHGLPGGEGDGSLLNWSPDARWQVVRVDGDWVNLGRKIKFQSGFVLHTGTQASATGYLAARVSGRAVVGLIATCGICSYLIGGYQSTLMGGDWSTLIGGDKSTLTGGYRSTLIGGNNSRLTGGYQSILTGGYCSTLTCGNYSTLTGGYQSILTGGDCSVLTAGDDSRLTTGQHSKLTGGKRSNLTAGKNSTLCWQFWDGGHYRLRTAYVGEDGIEPDVAYWWGEGGPEEVR
jgi:hypothetical protein